MLTDEEAAEIKAAVEGGTRGPVLIKWVEQLSRTGQSGWLWTEGK
jgi:hypothetical protein